MVFMFFVLLCLPCVFGQEQAACYSAGSVTGAAIGAFIVALVLVAVAYYLRKLYSKRQRGKHLVLSTEPQNVKDEFAFDNPGFKEEKLGWQHDAPTLRADGALGTERVRPPITQDDTCVNRPKTRRVNLWARDFTGLGFTCGGGAREGVHVHSVLKSGPAAAAKLQPGDRIKSIHIELSGTPLEDAVSILSLASPYPVQLEVVSGVVGPGEGRALIHPLRRRTASEMEISTLEREQHQRPQSPKQHSQNSTLESKHSKGIKKAITEKLITNTLERKRKEGQTTLERENEKNSKMANRSTLSDIPDMNISEKIKTRHSTGTDYQNYENGGIEHAELQKKENNKRGMKFGIRVLPPNIPDDKVLSKQNSVENGEIKAVDEPDKPKLAATTQISHENEVEVKKPVVAKRREKVAPPIPNARTVSVSNNSSMNSSLDSSKNSEPTFTTFARDDNNSGLKRDKNGIPLELPPHMLEAAKSARNNRKSSTDLMIDDKKDNMKKEDASKPAKKSKGKAPSPPAVHVEKNKTDDSMIEQMKNVHDFLKNEKQHSSLLHDSSIVSTDNSGISYTSTPKVNKSKPKSQEIDETMSFSQDDIDDIVSKPFKKEIEPNSSMHNLHGVTMYHSGKSDKGSTTIELNYSDITVHSSPNDTIQSVSDDASLLDENERKAASLGDLSRFALRNKQNKPTMSTLERAQSLDISTEDPEIPDSTLSPKKKKAYSVVETTFFESSTKDVLPEMDTEKRIIINQGKEPRLSLNMAKTSAMDGLNTFQRNRLKKGSEFGNLEDAIVKGSSSSIDSDKVDSQRASSINSNRELDENIPPHETSDDLARKILDENMKVHLKLVSEFAKSTSDGSEMSSLDSTREKPPTPPSSDLIPKYEEKMSVTYDTNIPDDMKVSSNTYVNSLERPKSEMMKKLLAKNPIFNKDKADVKSHETITKVTESTKLVHQPDIVKFDIKTSEQKPKEHDDFISNIRVGSANNTLNKKSYKNQEHVIEYETSPLAKSYTKSIEIGESTGRYIPDVIEGIKRRNDEKDGKVLYMEPPNVVIKMTEEPVQKIVTVNVAEDKFGNRVITQNVEKISTKYVTAPSEAPLEVEQLSFGIMKSPDDISKLDLDEGNVKDIDKKILDQIRRQNPNMHFSNDEPAYTKTETIILNTELDEDQAMALMEKIKNDPSFMTQKTPEELSKLGIRIIRDLEDVKHEDYDVVEVTKTRYSINPSVITESRTYDSEPPNHKLHENVMKTEIREKVDKIASRQRQPIDEPVLSYELDKEMLNDFITNERYHSGKQHAEVLKRTKPQGETKHSDFGLPRNSHIKFRTATYESPKGTIVTSTDIENRRLSQLEQMQLRDQTKKPTVSAKPIKTPEKPKPNGGSSKIPVFNQKSLSSENLTEKKYSLPRPQSHSSGNILADLEKTDYGKKPE